ncbi:MAG: hypothetical protein ACK4NZ_16480 [Tsuneonella sp.]
MEPLHSYDSETYVERRASRRVKVTCEAVLQTMTTVTHGALTDISEAGARLEALDLPGAGATALLRWGNNEAVCIIAWSDEGACGLSFKHALSAEVVTETAALNREFELPIASVGNISQGRKRSLAFLKTAPQEDPSPQVAGDEEPPHAAIGRVSLGEVLARYRRTGTWDR